MKYCIIYSHTDKWPVLDSKTDLPTSKARILSSLSSIEQKATWKPILFIPLYFPAQGNRPTLSYPSMLNSFFL